MPFHGEDLDPEAGNLDSRQHAYSQERRARVTWYHVIVPSAVLLLNIVKVKAAMDGDDFKSNILELTISVGISSTGSCILFIIKDMKIRAFYWFFEDDCRDHVKAGFEWVCVLSIGRPNKGSVQERRDSSLSQSLTQFIPSTFTTSPNAPSMVRNGRLSLELDRHMTNAVLAAHAAARASIESMDIASIRVGSSSPGDRNIVLPVSGAGYAPRESTQEVDEFFPFDAPAYTMVDACGWLDVSEPTIIPSKAAQTPSDDTSEPMVSSQYEETQGISEATDTPFAWRNGRTLQSADLGVETLFRHRGLKNRRPCDSCREAQKRCVRPSGLDPLAECERCKSRGLQCITRKPLPRLPRRRSMLLNPHVNPE